MKIRQGFLLAVLWLSTPLSPLAAMEEIPLPPGKAIRLEQGEILTVLHVMTVENPPFLPNGTRVQIFPKLDLAILNPTGKTPRFPRPAIGDKLRIKGKKAAVAQIDDDGFEAISDELEILPGDSGCAVFSADGKLVGLVRGRHTGPRRYICVAGTYALNGQNGIVLVWPRDKRWNDYL